MTITQTDKLVCMKWMKCNNFMTGNISTAMGGH